VPMHRLGLFRGIEVWLSTAAPWARTWVLPVAVGFFAAAVLTALLIRIAPKRGWVSLPRQDRWNARVVAHFGGVPVLLAFSIAASFFFRTRQNLIMLLLTWGMAMLGLADDIAGLRPKTKLAGQTLLAGLAVYAGIVHPLTPHFWINAAFTMFWIVGITNALNLLDNMDGLAAGIAIIAAAQVVLLAGPANPISGLALCLLASIAGFLIFNMNPAKVFMGDVGALSIGFFLGCASVKTAEHLSSLASVLFVPCLVLFIPVFDTLLVSVTRRIRGRRISLGARDHASHRLVLIGLSERQAVALLCAIAAIAGLMGFLWKSSWGDLGAGIVALFLIGSTLFWVYLAKLELPTTWLSSGDSRIVPIPRYLQQVIAAIFFILLDAAVISLGLYFAYLVKFERLDRVLFGRFLFTAALALAIQLPLLIVFAAYEHKWIISRRRDVYPILKAVVLGACLLTAISAALPKTKAIESSVILFDAVFTCLLLVLCRASRRIFDDLFGKPSLLDLTVKKLAIWSRLRASGEGRPGGPADEPVVDELAMEKISEGRREVDERPN
jgi:UDP-GlcNAc:undecaprenyl-phosphate/decaprenyl-phosphate GlcNAc-1-phosphate transferase